MTDFDTIEIHRMPDGTEYRAVIAADPDPEKPYDEGAWPILEVTYRHYDYRAKAFNAAAELYVDKFNELYERVRELRVWERYAKIFLGAQAVHEYGFNRGTDNAYIAFDPKAWREAMGFLPNNELGLVREKPLAEIQAWIEGDVYGRAVHKRYNPDEDLEDDEDWTDFADGSWVWGFYGRKYAEDAAKEELASIVANHKVVYRYDEHEKIQEHEREINAIIEFLDATDYEIGSHNGFAQWRELPSADHQRVAMEFFNIDYDKILEERELMFKRLQIEASKQAGLAIKTAQEADNK